MNEEVWHANITINDALVTTCIENQFPSLLPILSLVCIGEGWDNTVYLLNNTYIFRFPRREIAVQLIERENAVLGALQSNIELDIPNPIYHGKASKLYPYPFHGYKIISGATGEHANLSPQQRVSSIVVLAQFLKQLHSITAEKALQMGALPQVFNRMQVQRIVTQLSERADKIQSKGIAVLNRDLFNAELERALQISVPDEKQCLIHGDLYSRHLVFNHGRLTGIIDWGDVGINSPAVDLAVVWCFYPQSCHDEFFKIYGPIAPAVNDYARFLGLFSAITTLVYGHDLGDSQLMKESIDSIKRINHQLL